MSTSLPLAEVTQIGLFITLTNTGPVFVPGTMCLQRKCGSGERTLTGNLSCPRIPTFYPLQGPTNSNMYQHFFLSFLQGKMRSQSWTPMGQWRAYFWVCRGSSFLQLRQPHVALLKCSWQHEKMKLLGTALPANCKH